MALRSVLACGAVALVGAVPASAVARHATARAGGPAPPALCLPPAVHCRGWSIRSVDTMKLSRDTLHDPLSERQIAAVVRLDARLHLTHVAVDVYYDAPDYLARWVRAIRAAGLHVWFRAHWYAWESHRVRSPAPGGQGTTVVAGTMGPRDYVEATRQFLRRYTALLENGDVFDFCPEPENGSYWLRAFGKGWSWRSNEAAKHAFNTFIRSGVYMARTTLANRGLGGVVVTAISVDSSVALRLLSKPTLQRLGLLTLDLYPEGRTRDPRAAASRLVAEIAAVHRRWGVPVLLGEHGYSRDMEVDDATQARVLAAELDALARLPYVVGLNYWVDAGGPGYGGYTNLYRYGPAPGAAGGDTWQPRPAARVLARAYAQEAG